jgi:Leucine-rich repeat (LRR) protein
LEEVVFAVPAGGAVPPIVSLHLDHNKLKRFPCLDVPSNVSSGSGNEKEKSFTNSSTHLQANVIPVVNPLDLSSYCNLTFLDLSHNNIANIATKFPPKLKTVCFFFFCN